MFTFAKMEYVRNVRIFEKIEYAGYAFSSPGLTLACGRPLLYVLLHGYGLISPDTDNWYAAVAVNDVVYMNKSFPYGRNFMTWTVNPTDCTATGSK